VWAIFVMQYQSRLRHFVAALALIALIVTNFWGLIPYGHEEVVADVAPTSSYEGYSSPGNNANVKDPSTGELFRGYSLNNGTNSAIGGFPLYEISAGSVADLSGYVTSTDSNLLNNI